MEDRKIQKNKGSNTDYSGEEIEKTEIKYYLTKETCEE